MFLLDLVGESKCEILPVYDEASEIGRMRRKRTDRVVKFVTALGCGISRLLHDGTIEPLESIDTHSDLALC